jgi:hypothetical protein
MATAQIQINSTPGSNTDLPLNTSVSLSNSNNTGVTTWEWTILSQPAGTAVTLSSLIASTTSFTPTKEGSYLLRLVVNKGLAGEATDQVVAAVLELETRSRIPAAGETIEVDSNNGWSNAAVSEILQRVTRFTDNGILVGKAGEALTPLQVVHISDATEIGVLPAQQRTVPSFEVAYANIMNHLYGTLGVYLGTVAGAASASTGDLVRVMSLGPISGVTLASGGLDGDPVYVNDTGALSLTPGTNSRQIGTIAHATGGTTYDLWISGLGGASGAPVGPAGGVLGYPSSTYPNPLGLAADSANEIKLAPYSVNTNVNFAADDGVSGNGTTIQLTAGDTTAAGMIGGDVELFAGASAAGDGGAVRIYSGNGLTAGELDLFVGTSSTTVGASATFRAGRSQTLAGGALYLQGGISQSSTPGTAGGAVNITGGFNSNSGTLGGDVVLEGGYGAAAPGGKLRLGGGVGTVGSIAAGSVTLQGQDFTTAGMSGGSVALLAGNGGSAGQAGAISITAGNSTYNNVAADGGAVAITAGSNTTASGQGGSIVMLAGTGGTATGALFQLVGGKTTYEGSVRLTGGNASISSVTGGAITVTSGNGISNTIGPGAIDLNVGTNVGTATADISIGTSGSLGTVVLGKSSVPVKVNGCFVENPLTQALSSNGNQIIVQSGVTRVTAAVTAINLTSTPTLPTTGTLAGTRVLIFNAGSNNVTLNNDPNTPNTKLKLGANSRVLTAGGIIELIYMTDSTSSSYWYEIAFRG